MGRGEARSGAALCTRANSLDLHRASLVEAVVAIASVEEAGPVISIRRMSLGGGYRYLMDSVAAGDGNPEPSKGLAALLRLVGHPAGRLPRSRSGRSRRRRGVENGLAGERGAPLQHARRAARDPVSGEPVGATPRHRAGKRAPVAGFDLTLQPVEVGLGRPGRSRDEETKAVIAECHREAIEYVISYAETRGLPLPLGRRTASSKRT